MMDDTIYLLILSIISVIAGFLLDKYGFKNYKDTKDLLIRSLEDKRITKEEILAILDQFEEDMKE